MNYKGYVHDHSMSIPPSENESQLMHRISGLEAEIQSIKELYNKLRVENVTLTKEKEKWVATSNTQITQLTQSHADVARLTHELATRDSLQTEVARLKREVDRLQSRWYHKFTRTNNSKSVEMLLADLNEL